ncbi:MAG: PAS domain S-box protein, partial [Desulfobacula sp.]|nr:PAS domain S-box protein [Desulfobacula sp.]
MDIGKQWRHIIDSVPDGIIIVDDRGYFIAANQTAQLITGYSEKELKGQSCRILNCTGCKLVGKGKGKKWCQLFSEGIIREKKCVITNSRNRTIPIVKNATV